MSLLKCTYFILLEVMRTELRLTLMQIDGTENVMRGEISLRIYIVNFNL